MRRFAPLFLFLVACSGGDATEDTDQQDPAEYGCFHIAEGTIVDAGLDRDESAPEVVLGLEPYRVNLRPDPDVGYLRLEVAAPTDTVLLISKADTARALWTGGERTELGPGEPNPNCETDIEALYDVSLAAGTHYLELGPSLWASVWLMAAPR